MQNLKYDKNLKSYQYLEEDFMNFIQNSKGKK